MAIENERVRAFELGRPPMKATD